MAQYSCVARQGAGTTGNIDDALRLFRRCQCRQSTRHRFGPFAGRIDQHAVKAPKIAQPLHIHLQQAQRCKTGFCVQALPTPRILAPSAPPRPPSPPPPPLPPPPPPPPPT